jgi:Tfp pilus assembly protein PilZ
MPVELDGRVAWYNPGGVRKRCLREGAGVQFVDCEGLVRQQIEEFVYELVEETLVRANLL